MANVSKILKVSATATLLASILAACGSNNDNGGNASPGAASPSGSGAVASSASDEAKPSLKRLDVWQGEDYQTYPVGKLLEEKTGYQMKYDMLPQDKWAEKLNLIMASGEAYDLVTMMPDMALYSDYAQKGALTDLTPLIEQFGPNIQDGISQQSFDALKVNGKIYAIPMSVTYEIGTSILIRTDWLEKVGMPMPTTTDELTAVLQAFKDKDPGGNGDQNVPLTIKGDYAMLDNIVGAFGMPNTWNDIDGQLVPRVLDPQYKDYVVYVGNLYKQGLLDREFVVNKDATAKEKFSSGKAGAIVVHWADIPALNDALLKVVPEAKFAYIPAMKGPAGRIGFAANSGFDRLTFIPKASKHPEDAMKWINASMEPETFKELAIGVEGTHHKVENGAYVPILPIFNDERNLANNYIAGADEKQYPLYWQARVRKNPIMYEAFDALNNKQPAEVKIQNKLGKAPYMPQYAKTNLQLETMVGEFTVRLIAGAESIDGLEAFQAKYKAAGGEAAAKEINEWYATTE